MPRRLWIVFHELPLPFPLGQNLEEAAVTRPDVNPLADIDPRLLSEAFRRARAQATVEEKDSDSLLSAIIAEARKGTRDLYGLVKAAGVARSRAQLDREVAPGLTKSQ